MGEGEFYNYWDVSYNEKKELAMNEEIAKNLSGIWYLATSEGEQPHVRPMDSATVVGERVYFGTAKDKNVYQQMVANPKVEVFAMTDFGIYRFMAEVEVETDAEVTKRAFEQMGKVFDAEKSVAMSFGKVQKV